MQISRTERRLLEKENNARPLVLQRVPREEWPMAREALVEVWRSRNFLVQVYEEANGFERLSICSTWPDGAGRWQDRIAWDELMILKRQCGRGDRDALEVYPADGDIVNVANMRHLWLPPERVPFAWRRG